MPNCLGFIRDDFFTGYVLSYCICIIDSLVSFVGALCYAEIGTVIPRNGAEVVYLKEGILTKNHFHMMTSVTFTSDG